MSLWADMFVFLAVAGSGFAQTTPSVSRDAPAGSLEHFRKGEEFLKQRDLQSAANEFHQALGGDRDPSWTVVWSLIDLGRTFDATGQRDRAISEYKIALIIKDDTFGAAAIARGYIQTAAAIEDFIPIASEGDTAIDPVVLTRVEPEYPAEALLAGLEGDIGIAVELDAKGSINGLEPESSLGLGLDESAAAAVRRWTFAPATFGGKPAEGTAHVRVHFRLPERPRGWHATKVQFTKPEAAARPILTNVARAGKMSPELEEEATIDAAISRTPVAIVTMGIDSQGHADKAEVKDGSLPEWGEDAVRTVSQWRFSAAVQDGMPVAATCIVELAWSPPAGN